MNHQQMIDRCPDVKFKNIGFVVGFKFLINQRGVATIVPKEDSLVYGVIWELSFLDIDYLDHYEGVSNGFYEKKIGAQIITPEGNLSAFMYIATQSDSGSPRSGYLEKIINAAIKNNINKEYITELKTWITE